MVVEWSSVGLQNHSYMAELTRIEIDGTYKNGSPKLIKGREL